MEDEPLVESIHSDRYAFPLILPLSFSRSKNKRQLAAASPFRKHNLTHM
jgi:hypothetical protein